MAQKFPKDEFDSATVHGGRHRARRTKRDRIREFVRVLVVATVVGLSGIIGLKIIDGSVVIDPSELVQPSPSASTSSVKATGVTVLDATEQEGLASEVAHKLLDAGWNVLTADNLDTPTAPEKTLVFISSPQYESASKSLLKTLGEYEVQVSVGYSDPITVVLGKDFK
ncbi:MAG: hypothetical protein RIR46_903 [Actinomycetota bacterium]|jgi:hypothetical protein